MEKEKEREVREKEFNIVPAGVSISAQTFTFRELAAATRNFRPECFLGEGGFGRVYKGHLESTGQVISYTYLFSLSPDNLLIMPMCLHKCQKILTER